MTKYIIGVKITIHKIKKVILLKRRQEFAKRLKILGKKDGEAIVQRGVEKAEKINEIARMIGGSDLTKLTIENARELVNLANDMKMEIKKE